MRENRFRAWDKKRGKMIYTVPEVDPQNCGNLIYCDMETIAIGLDGTLYLIDECGNYEYPGNIDLAYEVMEYISRKDKNGKKIFEGDILLFTLMEMGYTETGVIAWHDSGFFMQAPNGQLHLPAEDRLEVIGNIYEGIKEV